MTTKPNKNKPTPKGKPKTTAKAKPKKKVVKVASKTVESKVNNPIVDVLMQAVKIGAKSATVIMPNGEEHVYVDASGGETSWNWDNHISKGKLIEVDGIKFYGGALKRGTPKNIHTIIPSLAVGMESARQSLNNLADATGETSRDTIENIIHFDEQQSPEQKHAEEVRIDAIADLAQSLKDQAAATLVLADILDT